MRTTGRGRAGKCLLELLIAVAIIAVMLGMMLPAAFQVLKATQALGT